MMSTLPPNLVGPILQSNLTQRKAAQIQDSERNQRTNADRRQTKAIDEQDSTVETTDNDTQVHSDAEGSGSQGRPFTETPEPETPADEFEHNPDDDHGQHIDLEA